MSDSIDTLPSGICVHCLGNDKLLKSFDIVIECVLLLLLFLFFFGLRYDLPGSHWFSIVPNTEEVIISIWHFNITTASAASGTLEDRAFLSDYRCHLIDSFIKFFGEELGADGRCHTFIHRFLLEYSEAVRYANEYILTTINLEQDQDLMTHHEKRATEIIFNPNVSIITY